MIESISIVDAPVRPLAAVRAKAERAEMATTIRASFDKVYAVLRARNLTGLGHNVIVYHDPASGPPFDMVLGVETPGPIAPEGEVFATETPGGRAAVAVHYGPYDRLVEAHAALQRWLAERGLKASGDNIEVYGDHDDDPAKLRTDIVYPLAEDA